MAAVEGRVGATEPPLTTSVDSSKVLPIDGGPGDALPGGGLPRGAVVACTGRRGPLLGMLAAATTAGEWTAVAGWPGLGLLAVAEIGGDLIWLSGHRMHPGARHSTRATAAEPQTLPGVLVRPHAWVARSRARAAADFSRAY